jgi:DnaJ-class molecular chaperone
MSGVQESCSDCGGIGQTNGQTCETCNGTGHEPLTRKNLKPLYIS